MQRHRSFRTLLLLGVAAVFFVAGVTLAVLWRLHSTERSTTDGAEPAANAPRNGRLIERWPNGHLRSDVSYLNDVYDGESRTYYESGAPYELRHYRLGHEDGVQQSWTDAGVLYLNYEVHDGRRYGLVNPSPCNTVGDAAASDTFGPVSPVRRDAPIATPTAAFQASSRFVERDSTGLPYYDDASFTPRWTPVAHTVKPFSFDTQTGGTVSNRKLDGQPYVASFIYTKCAAVCPLVIRQLSRVVQTFSAEQAHIVSFSVTPESDTPEALARFGRERGIDNRKWSLATGVKRDIYALARSSFFADDARVSDAADDESAFLHTEKLLLVDGDGHLRGVYNGTQPFAVDQLIADLHRLTADSRR